MSRIILVFTILFFTQTAFSVESKDPGKQKIVENFQQFNIQVDSISSSPIESIYQVMTDKGLFYFSKDGNYLFNGSIIDINQKRDLKEEALAEFRLEGIAKHSGSVITFKAPEEKYKVTVFTDITCGYCRKLHQEITEYNKLGITVNYLAFPRGGPGHASFQDMEKVWCADDQQFALTEAKNNGNVVGKTCSAPVLDHYELGVKVGVTGTPAIIMPDGIMIPGYQPAEQLLKTLETL